MSVGMSSIGYPPRTTLRSLSECRDARSGVSPPPVGVWPARGQTPRVERRRVVAVAQTGWVTIVQPMLPLWDEPPTSHRDRILAHQSDRVAWLKARSRGVTATDVARLTGEKSVKTLAMEKLLGSRFGGNAYTAHGLLREPMIGRWAGRVYGMRASNELFHAEHNRDHLATPDGLRELDGRVELCEIKTTSHSWRGIPRHYLRQVWWQQYVLGAERTLVVWERHDDFVPVSSEPECRWVDRDDAEIGKLIVLADDLLRAMRREPSRDTLR